MKKWFKEILITQQEIEDKCKELAKWVDDTYKDSDELIMVGLLKGSIPFLAELMKTSKTLTVLDFMIVSSFEGEAESTGNLKILMDLKTDILDKDVLLVEDIVDSGLTLSKIKETLLSRKPKSLKIISLLNKPEGRKIELHVDKYGFEVPNKFLAGFGLDVKEKLRNVPFIGVFDKSKIDEL